ncbi:MAG: hypothetical protein ACE5IR_19410, partial [bacterium]
MDVQTKNKGASFVVFVLFLIHQMAPLLVHSEPGNLVGCSCPKTNASCCDAGKSIHCHTGSGNIATGMCYTAPMHHQKATPNIIVKNLN